MKRWLLLGLAVVFAPFVGPSEAQAAVTPSPCSLLTSAEVQAVTGLPVKTPYLFTQYNCVWDSPNFADDTGGKPYTRVDTIFVPYSGSGFPVLNHQDAALTAELGVPASITTTGPQEGPFPSTRIEFLNGLQAATIDYDRCDVADVVGGCSNAKGSTDAGAITLAKRMLKRVPFVAPPATDSPTPDPASTTAVDAPVPAIPVPAAVARHQVRPAVFASRLPDLRSTFGSASHDLINLLIAFAALLFVTFPAELFNKTFEEHYAEIRAGWRRWLRLPPPPEQPRPPKLAVFLAVVLAGAVLGSLLDPHAGFNRSTTLALAATFITIVLFALLKGVVETIYRRRRHLDAATVLKALPGGLAVAAVCVLLSRLVHFQPGYLYGVVAAVAFAATIPAEDKGRSGALIHVAQLVVGLLAWLLWLPVHDASSTWPVVFLTDLLGAVFVGALVSTTLTLFPLRFLDGGHVFAWRRAVWGGLFTVATFLMLAVMLNPNSSNVDSGPSNWVLAIVLLALFGAGSVGFAYYWHRRDAVASAPQHAN